MAPLRIYVGGEVECEVAKFSGQLSSKGTNLPLGYAQLSECWVFGEPEGTVAMNSCTIAFDLNGSGPPYEGATSIVCSKAGDKIEVEGESCKASIYPKAGTTASVFETTGTGQYRGLWLTAGLTGIKFTVSQKSIWCPISNGTYEYGTLNGVFALSAPGAHSGVYLTGEG